MMEKKRRPVPIADALSGFLKRRGLAKRVEQASAIAQWPELVGGQIAAVTQPISVTADGTLFVAVTTHAWMTELSLMEPQLLRALNTVQDGGRVRKIRFQLKR
ncbi:MAG TPA: DUF721 domain-containing protein [Gemmatimonadaceae bacterium]|nr:DUF721 domain-containing protein [Gemmatimonadaceae bacterium]